MVETPGSCKSLQQKTRTTDFSLPKIQPTGCYFFGISLKVSPSKAASAVIRNSCAVSPKDPWRRMRDFNGVNSSIYSDISTCFGSESYNDDMENMGNSVPNEKPSNYTSFIVNTCLLLVYYYFIIHVTPTVEGNCHKTPKASFKKKHTFPFKSTAPICLLCLQKFSNHAGDTLRYSEKTLVDHYRPLILGLTSVSPIKSRDFETMTSRPGTQDVTPKVWNRFPGYNLTATEKNINQYRNIQNIQLGQILLYIH